MSISTRSCCSTSYESDVLRDSKAVRKGWENELKGHIQAFPGTIDNFITILVPCTEPFAFDQTAKDAFSNYKPQAGKEVESYPHLLAGLNRLVAAFEADKKLSFGDMSNQPLDFPFHAFKDHHHQTKPDIAISFPGEGVPSRTWQHIASVIEVKATEGEDPFPRIGDKHVATATQVAKNARNLMLAHGFLASFVIGIYGHTVRIAHFDHTCALVSPRIDLRSINGVKALQKFFWHFTHPVVGNTVACSDPTVARLSAGDKDWIQTQLRKANAKDWEQHVGELDNGRRVEVYDEDTGRSVPYLLYHLIDVNGRLFSRATMVWRAIEDTRMWKDDELVCNPARSEPVRPQIVKEAWRQVVRTAEADFYRRFNQRNVHSGVATMVCGGDIGKLEIDWWRRRSLSSQSDSSAPPPEPSTSSCASTAPAPAPAPTLDSLPIYATFCSTGSGRPATAGDGTPGTDQKPREFPLPHPQHQTYSWRQLSPHLQHLERSHMRMVINKVGRPLTQFTSTRELVEAVRDAVLGHRRAWEDAQVLHRDVSLGNILITDEPMDEPNSVGFLHDFDYSSMEREATPLGEEACDDGQDSAEDGDVKQKERTGTYYFMAMELILAAPGTIHDIHHDLESFYWVVIWVVLRHTECSQFVCNGPDICKELFVWESDKVAAAAKKRFLRFDALVVKNNPPLTKLIAELTALVLRNFQPNIEDSSKGPECKLTYDTFLNALNAALAPDQVWPTNDWQRCTMLDDRDPRTVAPEVISTPAGFKAPAPPLASIDELLRRATGASPHVKRNPIPPPGLTHSLPPHLSESSIGAGRPLEPLAEDILKMPPMKRQKTGDDMAAPHASGSNGAGPSQPRRGPVSRVRRSASIRRQPTRASPRLAEKAESKQV
ncbi:hypothetical protein C2E23DRAFT_356433 [Lenzites betulinus]|nr:hypothetical protein C2E23DRAFT_356433 [Lenzites betulinus]